MYWWIGDLNPKKEGNDGGIVEWFLGANNTLCLDDFFFSKKTFFLGQSDLKICAAELVIFFFPNEIQKKFGWQYDVGNL